MVMRTLHQRPGLSRHRAQMAGGLRNSTPSRLISVGFSPRRPSNAGHPGCASCQPNEPAKRPVFSKNLPSEIKKSKNIKLGLARVVAPTKFAAPHRNSPPQDRSESPNQGKTYRVQLRKKGSCEESRWRTGLSPRENQNHAGNHADHQSARSQGTPHSGRKVEVTRTCELPTAPRSLSPSHDTYP